MMARFPLVLLPKRVVYVDDDGWFLDILQKTMPRRRTREFIESPDAALQTLSQETAYWRDVEALLSGAQAARLDGMGEAPLYVRKYFQDWRRFHLTSVLIVDHGMPSMTGIEMLRRLEACPARRVLLTGMQIPDEVIQAFNSGLIQKFIPKGTPNIYKEVAACSDEMHASVCEHMGHLVRSTLTPGQIRLLHEPGVINGLTKKVEELGWIEYVVVGQPFGLLGMSHLGPLQWLQLETPKSLTELAEALADFEMAPADLQAIRDGTALLASEIRAQLGVVDNRQLVVTDSLCAAPELYCGLLDLPVKVLTARDYGLDDIRSTEELMRSLLRDVQMAHNATAEPDEGDLDDSLDEALEHFGATSALSDFHSQSARAVVAAASLPAVLAGRVDTALKAAQRDRGGDGRRE